MVFILNPTQQELNQLNFLKTLQAATYRSALARFIYILDGSNSSSITF